jgi:hypothetical protein
MAGGWAWESDGIKGVVVNSNGLVTWETADDAYKINTVCIASNSGQITECYKRPQYAACTLLSEEYANINNVWGYP